jgi:hypothetical protein
MAQDVNAETLRTPRRAKISYARQESLALGPVDKAELFHDLKLCNLQMSRRINSHWRANKPISTGRRQC